MATCRHVSPYLFCPNGFIFAASKCFKILMLPLNAFRCNRLDPVEFIAAW